MFKVIGPMDTEGGGTYWLRCGTGFVNKDNSINIYLDALPLKQKGDGVKLQLREFTEEELRERAEKKATYASRGTLSSGFNFPAAGSAPAANAAADSVPF
jgi:hypothetical protein